MFRKFKAGEEVVFSFGGGTGHRGKVLETAKGVKGSAQKVPVQITRNAYPFAVGEILFPMFSNLYKVDQSNNSGES